MEFLVGQLVAGFVRHAPLVVWFLDPVSTKKKLGLLLFSFYSSDRTCGKAFAILSKKKINMNDKVVCTLSSLRQLVMLKSNLRS